MSGIAWNLLQPVDVGAQVQQGFGTGMALVKGAQTRSALGNYLSNPDDPQAFGALAYLDPQAAQGAQRQHMMRQQQTAMQQSQERAQRLGSLAVTDPRAARNQALGEGDLAAAKALSDLGDEQKKNIVEGGKIIRRINPQNDEDWQKALEIARSAGIDIRNAPQQYDEAFARNIVAAADALDPEKEAASPSSVREYEYARQQGYTGSFMDFQSQMGSPIVVDNGDGTKTIYPRNMFGGGSGGAIPPPPAGFQIVNDGGPTPPASGNFSR